MQIVTCQIGSALRLGDNTRIVIHRRQGKRVCLGATAPVGTALILGGAPVRPISGTAGVWSYLFSLHAFRRFSLGRFDVCIWLPGEVVPLAANCADWLHIGVAGRPLEDGRALAVPKTLPGTSPASASPAPPPFRAAGECRPLRRSA